MNCEIIRDLLPLYADQLTSPQTNQLIETHIHDCPECGKLLAQLRVPMESTPAEDTGYVKALRKQLQKRRIQNLCNRINFTHQSPTHQLSGIFVSQQIIPRNFYDSFTTIFLKRQKFTLYAAKITFNSRCFLCYLCEMYCFLPL